MSRFQFQIPTEDEARAILGAGVHQAEFYPDKIAALRRLLSVTSADERATAHAFNLARHYHDAQHLSNGVQDASNNETVCSEAGA